MEHSPPSYTDNFRELAVERQEFEDFRKYLTWQGVPRGAFGRSQALHSGRCCTTFGTSRSVCQSSLMSFVSPVRTRLETLSETLSRKHSRKHRHSFRKGKARLNARRRRVRCQSVHGPMHQPCDKSEHCSSRSDHDLCNFLMMACQPYPNRPTTCT